MDLSIHVPCTCIIDDEPTVFAPSSTIDLQMSSKYRIIEGKNREITFDKIIVRNIKITVSGVDLTIDRCACKDVLKIYVCKGSCVWLKNFFDIFPEMILMSEGHIKQFNYDGRYVVNKLTIGMNPDYVNNSSITGFQVVSRLDIKYQYNGLIQGYHESMCEIKKPDITCVGKCAKLSVKPISHNEQMKILQARTTDSYEILVNINEPKSDIVSICTHCSEIRPCFKLCKCGHILCNICIKHKHLENGLNLTPPYFICPINVCQKKVLGIEYLDEDDAYSL